jgi:hypothetical protein|tara:strand:+ start:11897 stop:14284 length:2388 start_codon:yes stop_codon:yes gene_type:complete
MRNLKGESKAASKATLTGTASMTAGFLSLKGAILGAASALGIYKAIELGRRFIEDAGRLETYHSQIQILIDDLDEANKAFDAIREFAIASPLSTEEVVQSFIRLGAVGEKETQRVTEALAGVALAFNRDLRDVIGAYVSFETESLRRLGIEARRTKDKAIIQSGDLVKHVRNDAKEIRAALLEIWDEKFGQAIDKATSRFSARMKVMQSAFMEFSGSMGKKALPTLKFVLDTMTEIFNVGRRINEAMEFLDADEKRAAMAGFLAEMRAAIPRMIGGGIATAAVIAKDHAKDFWKPFFYGLIEFAKFIPEKIGEALLLASSEKVRTLTDELRIVQVRLRDTKTLVAELEASRFDIPSGHGDDLDNQLRIASDLMRKLEKDVKRIKALREEAMPAALKARKKLAAAVKAETDENTKLFDDIMKNVENRINNAAASTETTILGPLRHMWSLINGQLEEIEKKTKARKAAKPREGAPDIHPPDFENQRQHAANLEANYRRAAEFAGLIINLQRLGMQAGIAFDASKTLEQAEALKEYNQALKEAGTITTEYLDPAERFIRRQEELNRLLQILGPQFQKTYNIAMAEARQELRKFQIESQGFGGGVRAGIMETMDDLNNSFAQGMQFAAGLTNSLTNDLSAALTGLVGDSRKVTQSFKDMGLGILNEINKIIVRMLVLRPIMNSLFGEGFATSGIVGGFLGKLNLPFLDSGGIVQGPGLVKVGPIREAMIPLSGPHAKRGGGQPVQITVAPQFNISAADSQDVERFLSSDHAQTAITNSVVSAIGNGNPQLQSAIQSANN